MVNEVNHGKGGFRKWITHPRATVAEKTVNKIDGIARKTAITDRQKAAVGSSRSREEVIINENALGGTFFRGIRSVRAWVWNGRVRRHVARQGAHNPN